VAIIRGSVRPLHKIGGGILAGRQSTASANAMRKGEPVPRIESYWDRRHRRLANETHTIIVETANRFARDLMVAVSGYAYLRRKDITLIAAGQSDRFPRRHADRRSGSANPHRRLSLRRH